MYSNDSEDTRAWARKLEAGLTDEPTLQLARRLQENRPPAAVPPVAFQNGLRRSLLNRYGADPGFPWPAAWRFAASAALLLLLGFAILMMWNSLARPTAVGSTTDPQPVPVERATNASSTAGSAATQPAFSRAVITGRGRGLPLLATPGGDIVATLPEGTAVTLLGEVQEQDGMRWQAVETANGSGWVDAAFLSPLLPDELTGDDESGLEWQLGGEIELQGFERTAVHPDGDYYLPGDTLRVQLDWRALALPAGDYVVFLHVLDAAGNLVAQSDAPPAGGTHPTSGWTAGEQVTDAQSLALPDDLAPGDYTLVVGMVDAASGRRLASADGTSLQLGTLTVLGDATAVATAGDIDEAWIEAVTVAPRPSADAPLAVEVTVGYALRSQPEAQLKLHLAHPDWMAVTEGRAPIDGVSEFVPIRSGGPAVSFAFTVDPAELASIVGTAAPVPVILIDRGGGDQQAVTVTHLPAALFALDDVLLPPVAGSVAELAEPVIEGRAEALPLTQVANRDTAVVNVPLFYELRNVARAEVEIRVTDPVNGELLAIRALTVPAGRGYQIVALPLNRPARAADLSAVARFMLPPPTPTPTAVFVQPTATPAQDGTVPERTPTPLPPPDPSPTPAPPDPPQQPTSLPPTAVPPTRTPLPPPGG